MTGLVIWITGLSGAGKTTLCRAVHDALKPRMPELVVVDGDAVRHLFGNALGFSEDERKQQIGRIQRLAKMLSDQGLVVVVGALYAHPDLLRWNRQNFAAYFEVYLDAPLELVRSRDVKGLYRGAQDGSIANVVGVDIPWHVPDAPDLRIDAAAKHSAEAMAARIIGANLRLSAVLANAKA